MLNGFSALCRWRKKSYKIRVCIDFQNVNTTTSKDEYHMHIAFMFINDTSGHRVNSFLW
jgi:hypothetical protein